MARRNNSSPLPRHPAVFWSRAKLRWPLLIWLAAAGAAIWLHGREGGGAPLRGVVETIYEDAAPLETARLVSCPVEVGQRVEAGEVLARFDTVLIDAEIALKQLEVEQRFRSDVTRIASDLRDARRRHSRETAELEALEEELERMEDLVRRRLLDTQDVVRFRTRYRALTETVRDHEAEIAGLEEELEFWRERQAEMTAAWVAGSGDGRPEDEELHPDGATEDTGPRGQLARRREQYTLRAGGPGVVAALYARPGTVVQAGSPVVRLVSDRPPRVLGFLPEQSPRPVEPGQVLDIVRVTDRMTVRGRVEAVNPEMTGLPVTARLGLGAGQTVRGRRFIVTPLEESDLRPGEAVTLRRRPTGWRAFSFLRRDG